MTATVAPWDLERAQPQPSTAVASAAPPQISGAGANALAITGQEWKESAAETDRFALHLDTLSAQDALNKLRARKEDLTFGPQNGFMNVKGGDVLKPTADGAPMLPSFSARFQAVSDDLGKNLSPRARQMFQFKAADEQTAYKGELGRHQLQQIEVAEVQTFKDTAAQAQTDAVRYASDPAKVDEAAQRAGKAAAYFAQTRGFDPVAASKRAESDVQKGVIIALLDSDQGRQALTRFDSVKDKLDGPDQLALMAKLKATAVDVEGDNLVSSAFGVRPPDAVKQRDPLIQQAAGATGVKPALLYGMMSQESGGNPNAVSKAGAGGLMQLMQGTAKDLGVGNVFDEAQNVSGGARYIKQQLDKYGGDERLALMAYNWGPGNVDNWIKAGKDPDKIPFETREYVQKVQGYATGYGGKADAAAFKLDLINRTDISAKVKINAFAKIEKMSAAAEAFKTSATKTLDDNVQSLFATALVNPDVLKGDTFSGISDQYFALGDRAKATRYGLLAAMEGTLKNGLQSATDAQVALIEKLAEGLPKEIVEAFRSGDNRRRAELASMGTEKFATIRKSVESNNVDPSGLIPIAKEAIGHFADAAKPEEARKISDYMTSALNARAVASGNPAGAAQAIADLTAHANKGEATALQLQTLDLTRDLFNKQQGLLKADSLKNGASIYARDVGPLPPLDPANMAASVVARAAVARRIKELSGYETIPFTGEEIGLFKSGFDAAPPEKQGPLMRDIAVSTPDDMLPHVAAAIAGKPDATDPVSRGYAAALSFYGEKTPESAAVADQILRGTRIRKDAGESDRKAPVSSDAWQQMMQDKLGNAFISVGSKVPAVIADAVASVYTYQIHQAGRQGEKNVVPEILEDAIKSVVGQTITRNKQMLLPPRGVDEYDFDRAIRSMSDGDVADFKTRNGSPVTAEKIIRDGRFSNAGKEGQYFVQIPDPAKGGAPGYVERPDGKPYILDLKPFLERAQMFPALGAFEDVPPPPQSGQGLTPDQRLPVPGIGPRP